MLSFSRFQFSLGSLYYRSFQDSELVRHAEDASMKIVGDFFLTLRPVFTVRFLRLCWYVYVVATLIELEGLIEGSAGVFTNATQWRYFLPTILRVLVTLVFVRLLIEVAIKMLKLPESAN